jgi:hypothetical protein
LTGGNELSEAGRGEEFEKLKGFLTGDGPKVPYRQARWSFGRRKKR